MRNVEAIGRRKMLSLFAAPLIGPGFTRAVAAAEPAVIRLGSALADDLTPALYGMHAGLFRDAGLEIQLQLAQSGAALAAAVAGGALDIAKSTLMALITAHTHGIAFKIVAGAAVFSAAAPTGELVVLNGGITSLAELSGKVVAISALKALDHLAILLVVDQNGGTSSTMRFIELPYSAMLLALESGRADAASIANPTLQNVLESGKARTLSDPYEAMGKRFMIAGWFCTQAYAAQNAAVVRRFAQVMREATTYTNAHPGETVDLVAAYTHIDADVIRKMNRLQSAVTVDPSEVQMLIDTAYRYKFIDSTFAAKELIGTGA